LLVGVVQFDCSGSVLDEVPFKMYEAFLFFLQGLGYGMQTNFWPTDSANLCSTVVVPYFVVIVIEKNIFSCSQLLNSLSKIYVCISHLTRVQMWTHK